MTASARSVTAGTAADRLDASTFRKRLDDAERARRRVIESFDDPRIVAALATAADAWLDRHDDLRERTIEALADVTGQHPDMLATGIDLIFGAVSERGLRELLRAEGASGAVARHQRPATVFYALAGNVPGQSVPAIVASLLARSIAVIRDSARQPYLTVAFRESIARIEPDLAAMILPVAWSSASPPDAGRELERVVVDSAGRVELFGSDTTLSALAARYANTRDGNVAVHGTRMSVGIVDATAELDAAADAFSNDVVMYEGRGCLTPQALVVEGEIGRARAFCEHLAGSLVRAEARWPRARGSLVEESARRAFVDRAEAAMLADANGEVAWVGRGTTWCIRLGGDDPLGPGPGLRCVRVLEVADRRTSLAVLAKATTPLAAVGVASKDQHATVELDRTLAPLGVTLVCPAGRMQAPPLTWQQDGRRRLGDLLEPAR